MTCWLGLDAFKLFIVNEVNRMYHAIDSTNGWKTFEAKMNYAKPLYVNKSMSH